MIRVLYIHHVGAMGGAARSLIEVMRAFEQGTVRPFVVTARGPVAAQFRAAGAEVIETAGIAKFDNTAHTYYRGLRWIVLLRELVFALFTWRALREARRRWGSVDLVHVNDNTNLAALVLARRLFRVPVVVHVRALQRTGVDNWQTRLVERTMRTHAAAVICIDETVRGTLPGGFEAAVVHNGVHDPPSEDQVRPADAPGHGRGGRLLIGIVGGLFRMKGVIEFVEAAHRCTQQGLDIEYLMVGDAPSRRPKVVQPLLRWLKLEQNVREEIFEKVRAYGLGDRLTIRGFTADLSEVYRGIDVLCFPSHLNGVGRPVLEAAFYGVPSIVAIDDAKPDTLVDGVTGLRVREKDPDDLARAFAFFHTERSAVGRMGGEARSLALRNFDTRRNARRIIDIYRSVLASGR